MAAPHRLVSSFELLARQAIRRSGFPRRRSHKLARRPGILALEFAEECQVSESVRSLPDGADVSLIGGIHART